MHNQTKPNPINRRPTPKKEILPQTPTGLFFTHLYYQHVKKRLTLSLRASFIIQPYEKLSRHDCSISARLQIAGVIYSMTPHY
ncbi:hypothetical protein H4Q26_001731 [Puccinia striiformis f. sp. tritici PST-130]|nr:hypothetical protein H4Q26_001731 [Puccinia striiformis f. sp. tritici PST-130]